MTMWTMLRPWLQMPATERTRNGGHPSAYSFARGAARERSTAVDGSPLPPTGLVGSSVQVFTNVELMALPLIHLSNGGTQKLLRVESCGMASSLNRQKATVFLVATGSLEPRFAPIPSSRQSREFAMCMPHSSTIDLISSSRPP
jgi:hypothetical protein